MDARSQAVENQVQKHKRKVAAGLAATWSVTQVVQAWKDAAPSSLWDRQQTSDWVRTHVTFDSAALAAALTGVWATGTVIGSDAADHAFAVAGGVDDSVRIATNFDWSNWSPGNRETALIANPSGGFADRLASRGVTLQGIDNTTTDRIGTILSRGLEDGLSPQIVSSDVAGVLIDSRTDWAATLEERLTQIQQDTRRAETIARTEMAQAVADEKISRYAELGVEQVQWMVVNPCDICADNDGEVRAIGDEFPSGDTQPPVHPNCNCDILPVIDMGSPDNLELALKPELANKIPPTIGVPGSLQMAQAQSRLSILPNPTDPTLKNPVKYVETPWSVVPVPTVDPNIWDNATIRIVNIDDLFGTDPYLKRKRVHNHIESMGQALTPFRSYAMVLEHESKPLIIDGHHRLMALWLLGLNKAPVWYVKDTH